MQLVDADSLEGYLRETGRVDPQEAIEVRELAGGVSNLVLLVDRGGGGRDFVVKQARPQLRVAEPWFCSVERIWREVEVLRICTRLLDEHPPPPGTTALCGETPRVLFADADNYLFAMSAAPPHQVWKQCLLAGQTDRRVAAACGDLLGRLHAGSWGDRRLAEQIGDRQFFDDLRVDPYYRHVARQQADLRPAFDRLIDSLDRNCLALVHGDYSPKNLLVYDGGLMLVDFEVGHYGDPAFDLGFFLSHLLLKSFYARARYEAYLQLTECFWQAYAAPLLAKIDHDSFAALVARTVLNCAGCLLARVDGKSQVDYLDAGLQDEVRRFARELLCRPRSRWEDLLAARRGLSP